MAAATLSMARSMAGVAIWAAVETAATFLTYWRAAAATSSVVAGGSSPRRGVMLRHMRPTLEPGGPFTYWLQFTGHLGPSGPPETSKVTGSDTPTLAVALSGLVLPGGTERISNPPIASRLVLEASR